MDSFGRGIGPKYTDDIIHLYTFKCLFPKHLSHSCLIQNVWKPSLEHPYYSRAYFLFPSYSKLMKIISEAFLIFQSMFLILFLLETDENPLWSITHLRTHVSYSILVQDWLESSLKHPSSSKASLFFSSYSKLILAALAKLRDAGRSVGKQLHSFHIEFT